LAGGASCHPRSSRRPLESLGVHDVTSPEYEAAIEMTRQALAHFDVPAHDIQQVASAIRRERDGPGEVETRHIGG
jgi:hypothetical protein